MENVLKALAELLGVGTDALRGLMDVTPDFINKVAAELPLFVFMTRLGALVSVIGWILVIAMVGLFIIQLTVSDDLEDQTKVRLKIATKWVVGIVVSCAVVWAVTEGVRMTMTPTIYSIEYLVNFKD